MSGWAPWIITASSIALAGVMYVGKSNAERNAADERSQWAEEKAQIERKSAEDMRQAIEAHNATAKQLETIHAESEKARAVAQDHAASAVAAGDRAARAERRLRDAAATAALAASAAASQAGASPGRQASAETARVLGSVLQDLDSLTGRIGSFANTVSRFADESYEAAVECSRRYEAIR